MTEAITVMSVRGQIVIPMEVRKKMKLKPRDRLIVYGEEDTIIMKRLDLPELKETFAKIRHIVKSRDKKYARLTEKQVEKEVLTERHGN